MDIFSVFADGISDFFGSIGDAIATALGNLIGTLLYYITEGLMFLVGLLQQMFNVFSGATKVQYAGEYTYLTDVFFQNKKVAGVYWAIALLGITLVIMFAIIAVIRKMFDLGDKQQNRSMGALLGSMFKSILIMLLLSFFLNAGLSITNVVINRIGYIFSNSDSFSRQQEIHFTDEQYAAMGRVYTTIGNYSLNESYDSRYNLNKCFNEVRGDLNYLERQGVFDFVYDTKENGQEMDTWQSTLQKLIYAANTSQDVPMDRYNEELSEALLEIMEVIRTNPKFYPLSDYQNKYVSVSDVSLDRVLFLSGTSSAANNDAYNKDPYLLDGLRGAFYTGEKSIYDIDEVKDAFNIGLGGISYIFIWVLAYFTLRNLLRCIFGCIMRIFNMVSLYLVAPLSLAPMPLDDGEKFKQWTMAMVIQILGILGSIVPMRLIILFAPIIMMPELVLFESTGLNFIAKVLMIVGSLEAVDGFSAMITGILANNSSMAAINATNQAGELGGKAFTIGKTIAGAGASIAGRVAGVGLKAGGSITGLNTVGNKIGEGISKIGNLGSYMNEHGGALFSTIHALRGGDSDKSSMGNDKNGKTVSDKLQDSQQAPQLQQNLHSSASTAGSPQSQQQSQRTLQSGFNSGNGANANTVFSNPQSMQNTGSGANANTASSDPQRTHSAGSNVSSNTVSAGPQSSVRPNLQQNPATRGNNVQNQQQLKEPPPPLNQPGRTVQRNAQSPKNQQNFNTK